MDEPQVSKPKSKLPRRSPVVLHHLVCYECTAEMCPRIQKMEDGSLSSITYTCPNCGYVHDHQGLDYNTGLQRPAKDGELQAARTARHNG